MEGTTQVNYASMDFGVILDEVIRVVPYAIPVVLAFIGFRKGYSFLKGQIKGA